MGAGEGKFSGFDALQKATTANKSEGCGVQIAPNDPKLEIIWKLLKNIRLIVMGEIDEEALPTMEDINESVKALNYHKKTLTMMSQIPSQIGEGMIALVEVVKKSLANFAR